MKKLLIAAITTASLMCAVTNATAALSSFGYFYIAYTGTWPDYTYVMRGAYATKEECEDARWADYGDGDAYLPYDGTGIKCTGIFEDDLPAYEDIIDIWNEPSAGGGNDRPWLDNDMVEDVKILREAYEGELREVLQPRRR